ncbi:T9SS type A sorting domain-containing protein [Winogradskyella sp.]|uniref:T9SS type A sorting domain-containing protein n=1 Tax=Winogradskyella sp. TaxID=1883156 RepID=UPI003F6C0AF3
MKEKNYSKSRISRSMILIIVSLLYSGFIMAQESSNTSGGDATGNGGSVAYSVGQLVYTTNSNSSVTVTQGVQQAFEIFTLDIKDNLFNLSLSVYPNPTLENITLQIGDYNSEKLSYQLFDMQGKQLSKGRIVAQQTQINMKSLPTATYFINVVNQENKKVQSFKIIKN